MAANDTILLAVKGTVAGQTHVHTLHFRIMNPALAEQDLIDKWQGSARTAYRGLFVWDDTPIDVITARQVCGAIPLRAPVEETELAPNRVGSIDPASATLGGQYLPSFNAAVVSVRTALAGRSRRGRFYLGGLTENRVNANTLTTDGLAVVQTYINALIGAFGAGGTEATNFQLVVHSQKLALPGVQCQDSSTFVQGMIARSNLGTMRSRKLGSGT